MRPETAGDVLDASLDLSFHDGSRGGVMAAVL
jgi:hypothetical protein